MFDCKLAVSQHCSPAPTLLVWWGHSLQVTLGRVNWVSLGGILGLAPLVSLGPLSIGPNPIERSCISAPQVCLDEEEYNQAYAADPFTKYSLAPVANCSRTTFERNSDADET